MANYRYIGDISETEKYQFEHAMSEIEGIFKTIPMIPSFKNATVRDYEVDKLIFTVYNDIDFLQEYVNYNPIRDINTHLTKSKYEVLYPIAQVSNDISVFLSELTEVIKRMHHITQQGNNATVFQVIAGDSDPK